MGIITVVIAIALIMLMARKRINIGVAMFAGGVVLAIGAPLSVDQIKLASEAAFLSRITWELAYNGAPRAASRVTGITTPIFSGTILVISRTSGVKTQPIIMGVSSFQIRYPSRVRGVTAMLVRTLSSLSSRI